jgi:glycosyltransferase involved in cell wall biosynthesis
VTTKTRVVFVINDLRRAGAETQLVTLATGLDRARFQASVLILKTANDFESELRDAGVPVVALGRRSPWDLHVLLRLRRSLAAARPDVVHSYLAFANMLVAVAAPWAGVPVVILSQRSSYEASMTPFWRRVARWGHRRASHVIVNSESARREELAAGQPERTITCVPNGVALPAASAAPARALLGLPAGPLALCLAQLAHEKAHSGLLEAWPRVRDAVPGAALGLVGDGPLRDSLERQAARLGIADSVLFLGFRHPATPFLVAADVVVLPSLTEGLPNALLEAMALARPCVATAVGGIPELIEHGSSGWLVKPGDPGSLAEGLTSLLRDPERARAFGDAARERVRERFSIARMVEATERVYAAVIPSSSA